MLFNSVIGVPGTLEFSDIEDLARMVGIMRADVRHGRSYFGQRRVVGLLQEALHLEHHFVQFFDSFIPRGHVEFIKRLFIVLRRFCNLFVLELREYAAIPEQQMVREHPHRMIYIRISYALGIKRYPFGLFGRETSDGGIYRHEPILFVVRRSELFNQNPSQTGWGRRFLG